MIPVMGRTSPLITRKFPNGKPLYRGKRQVVAKTLRDYDIFELARNGMNVVEISVFLKKKYPDVGGLTPENVGKRLRTVMENVRTNSISNIEEYRSMCIAGIDKQLDNLSRIANGRSKGFLKIKAVDTMIKLWERKAKVLGLDQQVEKRETKHEEVVRIYHGLTIEDHPQDDRIIDVTPIRKELTSADQNIQ